MKVTIAPESWYIKPGMCNYSTTMFLSDLLFRITGIMLTLVQFGM
jgi:hypothetical protein